MYGTLGSFSLMEADRAIRDQLEAALGWLDLGNWAEANEELERLPPELRAAPQVLVLRCRIYAQAGRWQDVEMIAEEGAATYPEVRSFHTHWAWALHRQGRTEEGLGVATRAATQFPDSGAVAYALACLYGALDRRPEAREWLALAFERTHDPDKLKLRALDQPELFFLWEEADAELGPDDEERG